MKIEARVERANFFLRGEKRSIDTKVLVSESEYKQFGPGGTGQLAFIQYRPDHETPPDNDVDATSQARRLAMERGIPLHTIQGTGQDGRVLVGDVPEKKGS